MPEMIRDFYNVCPFCWSVRVKRRVFKTPKYLCEVCGQTHDQKKRISHAQRKLFNDVLVLVRNELRIQDITAHDSSLRQSVVSTVKRF